MNESIGQTIWQQMKIMDMNLIWCMAVRKPTSVDNGLRFEVSGSSFKGVVEVTLNGKDLYDVKFLKASKKQNAYAKDLGVKKFDTSMTVDSMVSDVFCDELMVVLENKVENRR